MTELDPSDMERISRLRVAAEWLQNLEEDSEVTQTRAADELLLSWAKWLSDERNVRAYDRMASTLEDLRRPEIRAWAKSLAPNGLPSGAALSNYTPRSANGPFAAEISQPPRAPLRRVLGCVAAVGAAALGCIHRVTARLRASARRRWFDPRARRRV